MAKKDLGNIEEQNKNLGGVSALFSPSVRNTTAKEELPDEEQLVIYTLRMPPPTLKKLKQIALDRGTSIKELIMSVITDKYSL